MLHRKKAQTLIFIIELNPFPYLERSMHNYKTSHFWPPSLPLRENVGTHVNI